MKTLLYGAVVILLLSVQMIFPQTLGGVPHLLFLLIVLLAVRQDQTDFLWLAFVCGVVLDSITPLPFGTYTLSLLVIAFAINMATRIFFTASVSLVYAVLIILVSFLVFIGMIYVFASLGVSLGGGEVAVPPLYLQRKVWIDLILTGVCAVPVYLLTEYVQKTILNMEHKNLNPDID